MISETQLRSFSPWPLVPLGEVVEFLDHLRKPVSESDRTPGPYPYYGANGRQGSIDSFLFDEPLLLLAEDGGNFGDPTRTIAYAVDGPCWANNHAHVLRPMAQIDLRFLCRQLEHYDVSPAINGATRSKLTKGAAEKLLVTLPPLPEQRRIATLLDKADAIRRKRREALKLADEFLRSAFLDLFGDPVTNPKQWPVVPITKVADIRDGTHDTPDYVSSGVPFVTSTHLRGDHIDFATVKLISEDDHVAFSRRSCVDNGDILFGMIGTIGSATLVEKDREFSIKNVALIKPDREMITSSYLWMLLRDQRFLDKLISVDSKGGTQKFVALGPLRSQCIPLPPSSAMRNFNDLLLRHRSLKVNLLIGSESADSLFGSLQQRAFNGELAAT